MQLSQKLKTFFGLFIAFLESALNFKHFGIQNRPHRSSILKLLAPKDVFT